MPYTHKALVVTTVGIVASAVLSLALAIGASIYVSVYEAHRSQVHLCQVFNGIVRKPNAPVGSALWRREEESYRNLQAFNRKYGC